MYLRYSPLFNIYISIINRLEDKFYKGIKWDDRISEKLNDDNHVTSGRKATVQLHLPE